MKEKTLCYRVVVREYRKMVNMGFIIVTFYDDKIYSLEGVFTNDYLTAKIEEDTISLEYYSRQDGVGSYEKEWEIPIETEYFELPLNVEAQILSKLDYEIEEEEELDECEEDKIILIETTEKIAGNNQKERCKKILQKFKNNNNVFN